MNIVFRKVDKTTDALLSKSLVSYVVVDHDFYRLVTICFIVIRAVASNRQTATLAHTSAMFFFSFSFLKGESQTLLANK